VIEAEESGGDIGDVLDSVTNSVVNVKKMKEERRSSAFSQIVQGYIIFFVFIAIMLILQLWLFPKFGEMSGSLQGGLGNFGGLASGDGEKIAQQSLDRIFFSLVLIQGFFTGLMVGKFSEGTIKQGLLHSLILMTVGALIITTAKGGI
jgi:flagellar protein FlaJ